MLGAGESGTERFEEALPAIRLAWEVYRDYFKNTLHDLEVAIAIRSPGQPTPQAMTT